MTTFSYKATTRDGRVVDGSMDSTSEAAVVTSLRGQGYLPLSVTAGAKSNAVGSWSGLLSRWLPTFNRKSTKVHSRDLMLFTKELATLLRAGMPLDRSLHSLADLTESARLKEVIEIVLGRVREGLSLSQAVGEHPDVFSPLYVNLIHAGEAGGSMESVLERLADYLERNEDLKGQVRSALVYPMVLVVVAGGVIVILLTWVLPKFVTLFDEMGQALPASTRFVMGVSDFIQSYWWAILGLASVTYFALKRFYDSPAGRLRWDGWALAAPKVGDLVTKLQVARFARTLGAMLQGGVPLIQSMEIVRAVLSNTVVVQALVSIQREITEGKGISGPLGQTGVFPSLAVQMVAVGEETGRLDEMLLVVADHYDREVGNAIDVLMSLLGPIVIVVMGLVAGFIVVAMMSAVFGMNGMDF